jgi:hypothetical protein
MSAAGGCRPQRCAECYFFFLAAFFVAFFFVATDITSSRDHICGDGLRRELRHTGDRAYFFFLAAFFVAFFFVATDITSSRGFSVSQNTRHVHPRTRYKRASWGFFVRVNSTVRSMNFCASLMAPSAS